MAPAPGLTQANYYSNSVGVGNYTEIPTTQGVTQIQQPINNSIVFINQGVSFPQGLIPQQPQPHTLMVAGTAQNQQLINNAVMGANQGLPSPQVGMSAPPQFPMAPGTAQNQQLANTFMGANPGLPGPIAPAQTPPQTPGPLVPGAQARDSRGNLGAISQPVPQGGVIANYIRQTLNRPKHQASPSPSVLPAQSPVNATVVRAPQKLQAKTADVDISYPEFEKYFTEVVAEDVQRRRDKQKRKRSVAEKAIKPAASPRPAETSGQAVTARQQPLHRPSFQPFTAQAQVPAPTPTQNQSVAASPARHRPASSQQTLKAPPQGMIPTVPTSYLHRALAPPPRILTTIPHSAHTDSSGQQVSQYPGGSQPRLTQTKANTTQLSRADQLRVQQDREAEAVMAEIFRLHEYDTTLIERANRAKQTEQQQRASHLSQAPLGPPPSQMHPEMAHPTLLSTAGSVAQNPQKKKARTTTGVLLSQQTPTALRATGNTTSVQANRPLTSHAGLLIDHFDHSQPAEDQSTHASTKKQTTRNKRHH